MCVIIDNGKLGPFFGDRPNKDTDPIHAWLEKRTGKLAYSTGGKFRSELSGHAKKKFLEFYRSGKAKLIPPDMLNAHEQILRGRGDVKSNDFHVIALANASGARLLYTEDKSLMVDFKNKDLISRPKGKIYSRAEHANLLSHVSCG